MFGSGSTRDRIQRNNRPKALSASFLCRLPSLPMTAILPSSRPRHTSIARITLQPLLSTQYPTLSNSTPTLLCYLLVSTTKYTPPTTNQAKILRLLSHTKHPSTETPLHTPPNTHIISPTPRQPHSSHTTIQIHCLRSLKQILSQRCEPALCPGLSCSAPYPWCCRIGVLFSLAMAGRVRVFQTLLRKEEGCCVVESLDGEFLYPSSTSLLLLLLL
jgi:hypothetical protein